MKPTFTFLLLILLLPLPRLYAQDFWETLPFPDTAHVRCMAVNNQGHIFVGAGSNNTIGGVYRSIDGGLNWEFMLNMGDFSVLSLEINNQGVIYVGTNHGFQPVYVSSNNGETWEEIILPSVGNILKIHCQGTDTIYVSRWADFGACLLRSPNSGQTWEEIFSTVNHSSEHVKDIAISESGTIYLGLNCYQPDMGGVYKSEDNGENWVFIGLFNHMVNALEINSYDDLFAGVWGGVPGEAYPGLYVLRNGEEEWTELLIGPSVADMVINSTDHIYFGSSWPDGVVRSLDNGQTFELINSGLPATPMGNMFIDFADYIYLTTQFSYSFLAKSFYPTVSIPEFEFDNISQVFCYPNPVSNILLLKLPKSFLQLESFQIKILDIYGGLIINHKSDNKSTHGQVDVSNLAPGIYILEISSLFNRYSQLFLKL